MDSKEGNAPLTLLGGTIMSCGNPLNHLANNVKDSFGGVPAIGGDLCDLASNSNSYDDDLMECLQFGICTRPTRVVL
ncbi:MAG: hypothetical protein ACJZ78_05290 [Prochlorococcus marinus]|tara:strand:- start:201 stop:431 length:231 start_codon:yes stop_codon:yes gene_type:complete